MLFNINSEVKWLKHFLSNITFNKIMCIMRMKREPILIAGCGRSGTSMLLSILSAHPNIYGIREETNIYGFERKFNQLFLDRLNNKRKLLPYLLEDEKILTATRWCEKTPRNIRYIEQINREFNNKIKIIHLIRDGRDVVTSHHPTKGKRYVSVNRWVMDVKEGLKFRGTPNIYEVKYEDLVGDFEKTVDSLFEFLEEDYSKKIIERFHEYTNVKQHEAFKGNLVTPLNSKSVGKWKNNKYDSIISEFYKNSDALELLKQLGYEI